VTFLHRLLQVHSGNCKIDILDLSLVKLLQHHQGCNFFASQCIYSLFIWLFTSYRWILMIVELCTLVDIVARTG